MTKNGLTEMAHGPDDARFVRTVTPPGGTAETTFFVRDMELSPAGVLTKYPLADAKRGRQPHLRDAPRLRRLGAGDHQRGGAARDAGG
ncbi:hypothetical protein L1787_01360, partial [Acuticoccus sp. M5D2P5]|uniref:hypothetical protein n=1 Tax=Acuticoccus kalidii TaxID=2910977 RepID=UPI001F3CF0E6